MSVRAQKPADLDECIKLAEKLETVADRIRREAQALQKIDPKAKIKGTETCKGRYLNGYVHLANAISNKLRLAELDAS